MMTGHVARSQILLPVTLRLDNRPDLSIEFVVDTGFTGFLTLPIRAVAALQLPYLEEISANFASDTTVSLSVHAATIVWRGQEREVRVLATGRQPLLGTALLDGHELVAQWMEGGAVVVEPL